MAFGQVRNHLASIWMANSLEIPSRQSILRAFPIITNPFIVLFIEPSNKYRISHRPMFRSKGFVRGLRRPPRNTLLQPFLTTGQRRRPCLVLHQSCDGSDETGGVKYSMDENTDRGVLPSLDYRRDSKTNRKDQQHGAKSNRPMKQEPH